jgi:hypothetical protein
MDYKTIENQTIFTVYHKTSPTQFLKSISFRGKNKAGYCSKQFRLVLPVYQSVFVGFKKSVLFQFYNPCHRPPHPTQHQPTEQHHFQLIIISDTTSPSHISNIQNYKSCLIFFFRNKMSHNKIYFLKEMNKTNDET